MNNTLRSRFVRIGGYRTHYTESGGDGPVMVAMHGGGAGSSGEAGMGSLMRLMPEDIRIVAPDSVGGFGRTDTQADASLGLQSRVDHLAALVDVLCLDRFTLLGNSQGAWVAARFAALYPGRIERLILLGSASIAQAMGLQVEPTRDMLALLNNDGSYEGMQAMLAGLVYDKTTITPELTDLRYQSAIRPGASEAFAQAAAGTRLLQTDPVRKTQFDLRTVLPALARTIETIFIWGENDSFALPELGRQIERMIPDIRFYWIPKAGHQVQNDQPERVAQIVSEFLRKSVSVSRSPA